MECRECDEDDWYECQYCAIKKEFNIMDICDSCGNIKGTSACKYCDANKVAQENAHKNDAVSHPNHYTSGGIECIHAIKSALTEEEFRGYVKGNVLKYVWRERLKNGDEDLKKAATYIKFLEGE